MTGARETTAFEKATAIREYLKSGYHLIDEYGQDEFMFDSELGQVTFCQVAGNDLIAEYIATDENLAGVYDAIMEQGERKWNVTGTKLTALEEIADAVLSGEIKCRAVPDQGKELLDYHQ